MLGTGSSTIDYGSLDYGVKYGVLYRSSTFVSLSESMFCFPTQISISQSNNRIIMPCLCFLCVLKSCGSRSPYRHLILFKNTLVERPVAIVATNPSGHHSAHWFLQQTTSTRYERFEVLLENKSNLNKRDKTLTFRFQCQASFHGENHHVLRKQRL
jgi:hypothetical protein